jgi:hypothetical protein
MEAKENKHDDEDDLDFEVEYNELKEKYSLPEFKKICEDFDIEKVSDKDSDFLLREIRRVMNEKISAYLHLFETLINPTSPPIFVFSILRGASNSDKESMKEIYKILAKTQLEIMKLDTVYQESTEVKFIVNTFEMWQKLKPTIMSIIENFETNFEKDDSSKKSSYFD